MGIEHEDFAATQWLLVHGVLAPGDPRYASLAIRPDKPLAPTTADAVALRWRGRPRLLPGACAHGRMRAHGWPPWIVWEERRPLAACAACAPPGGDPRQDNRGAAHGSFALFLDNFSSGEDNVTANLKNSGTYEDKSSADL